MVPIVEPDGLRTLFRYAGCAIGIAGAVTGLGLLASVTACMLLFYPDN